MPGMLSLRREMKRKFFVTAPPHTGSSRLPSHMSILYCTVLARMKSVTTIPRSMLLRYRDCLKVSGSPPENQVNVLKSWYIQVHKLDEKFKKNY